jgi:tRNA (cmo5U34)-methyltransferase
MPVTEASSIHHLPAGVWAFDDAVTDVFEDMLRRSIPDYDAMRRVVFEVGRRFVQPGTDVLDIGCSRGDALVPYIAEFGDSARYVGVEVSQPMLETVRTRFAAECRRGVVEIQDIDLREGFPAVQASLTLSVLTLQFIPVEHRSSVVQSVYEHTVDGGAFLLVEKIVGSSPRTAEMLIDHYHELKHANGYSREAIERKRLSLEGVLVPATAAWNEELLRLAGFQEVECIWRYLNFAAWVGLKRCA